MVQSMRALKLHGHVMIARAVTRVVLLSRRCRAAALSLCLLVILPIPVSAVNQPTDGGNVLLLPRYNSKASAPVNGFDSLTGDYTVEAFVNFPDSLPTDRVYIAYKQDKFELYVEKYGSSWEIGVGASVGSPGDFSSQSHS